MIRGGLRTRLVLDSVRYAIIADLQRHGWFDPTVFDSPSGNRRHQPFRYMNRPVDWTADIRPNAIAISGEDVADEPLGLGGEIEDVIEIYVDIFAQDDALGWQVAYDVRDNLHGKSAQPAGPEIDVYDFRQPTPAPFTTVDLDLIEVDRSEGEARQWQRHWFMVHIVVRDDYHDEFATVPAIAQHQWQEADELAWRCIQEAEQHVP